MGTNDGSAASLLGPLGLDEAQEAVYRNLLRWDGGSLADVVERTGLSRPRVRQVLDRLEGSGLIGRSLDRDVYIPAPPQAAIDILVLRRHEELEQARLAARQLNAEVASEVSRAQQAGLVELVTRGEAVPSRNVQMLMSAKEEILGLCMPPLVPPDDAFIEFKLNILRRGVKAKAVWATEVFKGPDGPAWVRFIETVRRAGEEPRVGRDLPMPLLIVDRRVAFVPAQANELGVGHDFLVVHRSSLLESLLALFHTVWERSIRFDPQRPLGEPEQAPTGLGALSEEERQVLVLLGAGMQDTAIADHLGMGARTVQRHVQRIMSQFGAGTRFQAGLEIGRQASLEA